MPAECRVKLLPESLSCHVRLARAALFARASVEDHRSGIAAELQVAFYGTSRGQRSRSKQVMTAAMTAAARKDGLRNGNPSLLAQSA